MNSNPSIYIKKIEKKHPLLLLLFYLINTHHMGLKFWQHTQNHLQTNMDALNIQSPKMKRSIFSIYIYLDTDIYISLSQAGSWSTSLVLLIHAYDFVNFLILARHLSAGLVIGRYCTLLPGLMRSSLPKIILIYKNYNAKEKDFSNREKK